MTAGVSGFRVSGLGFRASGVFWVKLGLDKRLGLQDLRFNRIPSVVVGRALTCVADPKRFSLLSSDTFVTVNALESLEAPIARSLMI